MFSTKKVLLTIPIALISLEIYFGVLFGYLLGKFGGGRMTGQPGRVKSIVFSVGKYRLHIHHWLCASLGAVVSVILFNFFPFPQFSAGIVGGFIFQGIVSYSDWYRIIKK